MMRSLNSAVAGLRTHQIKMDVIGNNIANVNTNGFKSSRTTFTDVYYQTLSGGRASQGTRGGTNPTQIGYGSQMSTIDPLMTNAGGGYSGKPFDVYIDGDGFLPVRNADGTIFYTRFGNLGIDGGEDVKYLVDYSGNYVMGIPLDAGNGGHASGVTLAPVGGNGYYDEKQLVPISFGEATAIMYEAQTFDTTNPKQELAYKKATNPGGDIKYHASGRPVYLAKDGSELADVTSESALPGFLKNNGDPVMNAAGTAQEEEDMIRWDDVAGAEKTIMETEVRQVEVGRKNKNILECIDSISIGTDGSITAVTRDEVIYNGETIEKNRAIYLGRLTIATFPNQDGLMQTGASYFSTGPNSGTARYGEADKDGAGITKAGYLEMSNVDISQEFTDMITTQRGFQANTRIITVSDEMLQELVNLKR